MSSQNSIARAFTEVVGRYPQNIAVDDPVSGAITYEDFAALVFGFARRFSAIGHEPKVLIHLRQGTMTYAAMLGALVCGATYAPVNIASPSQRHNMIMAAFAPDVIVSESTFQTEILIFNPELVIPSAPVTIVDSVAPSYVIFTSGSTGAPKGVAISRSAHAAYVAKWIAALSITPKDRISQHPSIAFDLSVADIFGALTSGATLVPFVRALDKLFPARTIRSAGVTVWNSTPSVVDFMSHAGDLPEASLPKLRLATFCGEPLLPRQVQALSFAAPTAEIHNSYGPTEATVAVTDMTITCAYLDNLGISSISLGHPLGGNTLVLLDENGDISDTDGEIIIAGEQLADGYWQDPERTSASFRTIDLGDGPERVYFTGDLGQWIDGKLYFIERKDNQVKIRGHRVELGSIANAVCQVTGRNAVAVQIKGRIFAVIEGKDLDTTSVQEVLRQTSEMLDRYAQPSGILTIGHFPRNENSKVDLKAITEYTTKKLLTVSKQGHENQDVK